MDAQTHKILVVDDESVITAQLEEMLVSMGYFVSARASSGEEAVELAGKLGPDLVLMDIVMPGEMDGIAACGHIQEKMDIPVVLLTAYGDDVHISRAKAVRPYGYVLKPYQSDQIKASVGIALEKKSMERGIGEMLGEFRLKFEDRDLKLKEINHRIKNNLNMITVFLNFKSLHVDKHCMRVLREISAQVSSIADVHERLYHSKDLETLDCRGYFKNLKNSLERAYFINGSVRFSLDSEDLELPPDKVLPIGLIVTELVSNALKYAFPDDRPGEIKVDLKRSGGSVVLTVRDNGVGFPEDMDIGEADTLGLELVRTLVAQLKGTMEKEEGPGAAFKIMFPG